jgi:hypothetical protein
MKLEILELKKNAPREMYELEISYMQHHPHGYDTQHIKFPKEKLDDEIFMIWFERLIRMLTDAVTKDNKGRGGIEGNVELWNTYAGIKWWAAFALESQAEYCNRDENLEEWEVETILFTPFKELIIDLPTENHGYYHSFDDWTLYYYDNDGGRHEVKVTL